MKKRRKIKLRYKKERVLLSDVLPYELPIIMSNRMLYRFCVKNKITYNVQSNTLCWNPKIDHDSFDVLKILFGPAFDAESRKLSPEAGKAKLKNYSTIPFVFRILHKDTDFRSLSIVHPAMQIGMTDFYNQYSSLIIHYCTRSNYSIRHPQKVASYFFFKDRLHHRLLGKKKDKIEHFFNEYENLKTFFTYKKYTQIYKFYDDYRFQRAEKRFPKLLRFDIQKCFDSVYTHSIAWATQGGKKAYKKTFSKKDNTTFGGVFDTMMQRLKYNETHGIVIGPEFSRIFAEIILQHIDRSIEYILENEEVFNGTNYQLYRYVDDYFLFYNEERVKDRIVELLNLNLEEYQLKIGSEKTLTYERPFLTEISQAKIRIDRLITESFKFISSEVEDDDSNSIEENDTAEEDSDSSDNKGFIPDLEKLHKILKTEGYYPLNSLKFNKEFKDALISVGVKAKDVLNYTLSCINTRVCRELNKFDDQYKYLKIASRSKDGIDKDLRQLCTDKIKKLESMLSRYLFNIVETTFLLFSLNRRLNTTLKLSSLLNTIIGYLNGSLRWNGEDVSRRFNKEIREALFGKILFEVIEVLKFSKYPDHTQLETLYLLIIMRSIASTHPIPQNLLMEHIGFTNNDMHTKLNAIAINVVLYYIGNKKRYDMLKGKLLENLKEHIAEKDSSDFRKDAESVILMLDLACCPYLEKQEKEEILKAMRLSDEEVYGLLSFGIKNKYFFTKWSGVNVTKELAAKISQEVYS